MSEETEYCNPIICLKRGYSKYYVRNLDLFCERDGYTLMATILDKVNEKIEAAENKEPVVREFINYSTNCLSVFLRVFLHTVLILDKGYGFA